MLDASGRWVVIPQSESLVLTNTTPQKTVRSMVVDRAPTFVWQQIYQQRIGSIGNDCERFCRAKAVLGSRLASDADTISASAALFSPLSTVIMGGSRH